MNRKSEDDAPLYELRAYKVENEDGPVERFGFVSWQNENLAIRAIMTGEDYVFMDINYAVDHIASGCRAATFVSVAHADAFIDRVKDLDWSFTSPEDPRCEEIAEKVRIAKMEAAKGPLHQ